MNFDERWQKVKDYLLTRKRAYMLTFNAESVYTQKVLADLSKFCRADETTFHSDPRIHAAMEGRREVWLRITNHLNLTPDQLAQIYAQKERQ